MFKNKKSKVYPIRSKSSEMTVSSNRGFTLIEILIVIGIIAILATIVIIAINPARQFAQARNTQRVSNVNTILNAIGQNIADNKGVFGGTLATDICNGVTLTPVNPVNTTNGGTAGGKIGTAGVNLSCLAPTYIASSIPMDPSNGTPQDTKYTVQVDSSGRITVCAPNSYSETQISNPGPPICVTR